MPANQPIAYTNPKAPKQPLPLGMIIKGVLLGTILVYGGLHYKEIGYFLSQQSKKTDMPVQKKIVQEKQWVEKIAATLTTPAEKEVSAFIELARVQQSKKTQYTYYVLAHQKLSTLYEQKKDPKYKTSLEELQQQMKAMLATPQTDADAATVTAIWIIDLEKEQETPLLPQNDMFKDISFASTNVGPHPVRILVYYANGTSQESLITLLPKNM